MTAVEQFFKNLCNLGYIEYPDANLVQEILNSALQMEKQQHGETWDAAIKAHDDRGHVFVRSSCDFDEYFEKL